MSDILKPVWVWLPGQVQPTQCGEFELQGQVGRFHYSADYLKRGDAVALDPLHLPLKRSEFWTRETRQEGLFGVIRDARPEGFGLTVLENRHAREDLGNMEILELSEGDGVGALEVCDDIESKKAFKAPQLSHLLAALRDLPEERPSSQAAREVQGIYGTSLGGERPKLTVEHKGQLWIAKLQDRGDGPNNPLREYVAMTLARECGVNAAEVEFHLEGHRQVVLVKRFDRDVLPTGDVQRHLYASAHTLLRLDKEAAGARNRSFVVLAHELQRWCARPGVDMSAMKHELWRRVAYNSLCGNFDDHARNHGLLYRAGQWGLSPAFDIAPYHKPSGIHALSVTKSGERASSLGNLLEFATLLGVDKDEARDHLLSHQSMLAQRWPEVVESVGFSPEVLPYPAQTWWAT